MLNLEKFEQKRIHFGFALGMNNASFLMRSDYSVVDSLISVDVQPQSGFNLGIISDLHLNEHFGIRFVPTLSFGQRNMLYVFEENGKILNPEIKAVESTFVDFPINLRLRSLRVNNFSTYFLGGFKYSLDLASQEKSDNTLKGADVLVRIKQNSWNWDVGYGFDFYMPYFKFGIEIKYSASFNNMLVPDPTPYSLPIESLKSKILWFSITFEG